MRVAREPERPCRFRCDCRLEPGLKNSRLIHSYVPSWWGRTGDKQRYCQTKATKCGETSGRESEHPVVPLKGGNHTEGTPWREGDAVSNNRWRETWRVHRNPWTCPRNNDG